MYDKPLNISILYAEDEESARVYISKILSRRVKDFYVANNGIEAFKLYEKHKPDIVISDIQMPEMNGLELIEKIKQINPNTKVIIMSAFTDTNYLLQSIQLQVDGFIVKPVRKEILLSTISKQADIIQLERKTKEQSRELIISENRFNAIFDNNPNPIHLVNRDLEIVLANSALLKLRGVKHEDIIGKKCFNIYQDNSSVCENCEVSDVFKEKSFIKSVNKIKAKDGSVMHLKTFAYPIFDENNEIVYCVESTIDITENVKAEEQIILQNIELKERNEELDAFSHTVAHDLKGPIGSMMGFAELLKDDYENNTTTEHLKYVNTIIRSGRKTQQIINSLLLFASVRKEDIETSKINMEQVVSEAIRRFSTKIEQTDTNIELPDNWPNVMGNDAWIEEVWANFISNAIKYGGTNPHLQFGHDKYVSDVSKKEMTRFWIRDNGIGISSHNKKTVFNKFERLNQANVDGQGLGLSIVKRIIEKQGGEVGLESKLGKGSLFYFTLQTAPSTQVKENKPDLIKQKSEDKKLKILIVEDEFTSDKYLRIIVEGLSKKTYRAKHGKEAVEIYHNNPEIDLILMDIKMPIMDGYEATRLIREINNDVIIIAHTASVIIDTREKAIAAGCNDYVTKPIDKMGLLKMIDKLI